MKSSAAVLLPAATILMALMSSVVGDDYFLTIGGGYAPSGNQASLENNVLFFQTLLEEQQLAQPHNDVYFADGRSEGKDLQVMDRNAIPTANRLMAEFFGSQRDLGLTYRNHKVPDVRGDTTPASIRRWFQDVGSTMNRGDRLILYVTAHGNNSTDRRQPYNTTIALWNNTSLKVTELVALLDGLPDGVEVVAIMVQCHAGGFSRFIFNEGDPDKGLSPQTRSGFFATVYDRPAAGCTPEVDEASYVEYSTYFWEALAGHSRLGDPIEQPDYDGDGVVSFDEAHAYTVLTCDSIDLPIRTSGEFLRLKSEFGNGDTDELLSKSTDYPQLLQLATASEAAILEGLSAALELQGDDRLTTARRKLRENSSRSRGSSRSGRFRGRSSDRPGYRERIRIAADLKRRWPELANVLNPRCTELLTTLSDEFVRAIETHRSYEAYRKAVDQASTTPDPQKQRVKLERFIQTAENVLLAENLRRKNDDDLLKQYSLLCEAEQGSFAPTPNK